mmetsp:Transcript_8065/g.18870  ORF Transcript_8065/g.18870 Transcript_8065/m.18870 type:complete len:271 (+) Transcript_8065:74-886(+)
MSTVVGLGSSELEGASDEEIRRLRRDHAIRERVAESESKRQQDLEDKRKLLQDKQKQVEQEEQDRVGRQLKAGQRKARERSERKAHQERLNQKRNKNIAERDARWLASMNERVQSILNDHAEEQARVAQAMEEARMKKNEKKLAELRAKNERAQMQTELDMKREDLYHENALQREVKQLQRVDEIKAEAQEEMDAFLQYPARVPLKQVLTKRVKPVPSVTELLAAYKDQREDLTDLRGSDLQLRALMRNQTLFQYVHDIQEAFQKFEKIL